MQEKELKRRLVEWGRWARDRQTRHHCNSLEHRYRSPQEWGDWENGTPNAIPSPIDSLAAIEVQKAIAKIGFQFAWALTFRYCYPNYDKWAAARFCKVYRPERLEKLTRKAELATHNQLKIVQDKCYNTRSRTVQAEILIAHREETADRQALPSLIAA